MAELTQGQRDDRAREARRLLKVAAGATAMCLGGAVGVVMVAWLRRRVHATPEPSGWWFLAAFCVAGAMAQRAVFSAFETVESEAAARAEQLVATPDLRDETFAELDKPEPEPAAPTSFWLLLLFSSALFVLTGGWSDGVTSALLLTAILAFHEAGHLSAMQAFGYKNTRILFIPFLGALTSGTPEKVSVRQEAIVLLAGPMPGLLLGVGLLWSPFAAEPLVRQAAHLLLLLNAFNLLPLGALDGGKALSLLLSRWPKLEAAFIVTSSALLAVIALGLQQPLLAFIAIASATAAPRAYRISRSACKLAARMPFPPSLATADKAFRRKLFKEVYLNALPSRALLPRWKQRLPLLCAITMRRVHAQALRARAGLTLP